MVLQKEVPNVGFSRWNSVLGPPEKHSYLFKQQFKPFLCGKRVSVKQLGAYWHKLAAAKIPDSLAHLAMKCHGSPPATERNLPRGEAVPKDRGREKEAISAGRRSFQSSGDLFINKNEEMRVEPFLTPCLKLAKNQGNLKEVNAKFPEPSVVANSSNQLSSSAGSSLEVDGILYQSLFSSVACLTATAQNHDHKEETKHILPTKESKKDTENKRANKRKKEREEKGSKSKPTGNNGGKASTKEITSLFPAGMTFKVPVIQLHRITTFTTPPVCRTQKKISEEELAESPLEAQSKPQEVLGRKSSDKGDVITSTPADVSRLKAVVKNGKTWSMPSTPTLEHLISPVPKESYLVALSNSSDFESPMSFKSKSNIHSNHEGQSEQSVESRYETCNSEINSKSSDSLPAVASEAKGTISACHLNKENYRDSESEMKRFYNSSLELESGPFKGVVIPARDNTKARKSSFGHAESSESEISVELSNVIGLRNVGTARTLKNRVTTRKRKGAAVEIRNKFESSADLSNLERSLAHMSKRNGQLTKSKQSLRTKQLGSKLSLKKSWAKPSPVLTRLRQKAPRQTKIYDISLESLVAAQENKKSTSISNLSGTEKSLVIGRRKRISKVTGSVKNRIQLETSDTDTSLVIPRRPPKKLSLRKKVKDNTSLKPSNGNSQFMSDADLSSVSMAENSQVKRRSGRLLAMKRQTFVPSPKLLRRKSARLCKNHLEESATKSQSENENYSNTSRIQIQNRKSYSKKLSLKNLSRMSARSVQGLEATAMSFGSVNTTVFTDFQTRKERRGNQLVYCKLESSEDMFDTSGTHISEVQNEEPVGFEEPQVIDKDPENAEQTSSDEKDTDSLEQAPPSGDSCHLVESSIHENSLLELEELEDVCRSVKVQCMIPVKGGKGWRRSCLSIAAAKWHWCSGIILFWRLESITGRHIQQMGIAHKVDMHTSHHTSFHTVVSTDASEPAVPSDPREYVLKLCSQVAPVPI
ncbi:LOW QUALITY PROTEIN: uncharacterized protein LOC119591205 [Penaeus monodon]|uniref:LOW QUALITY PROTEIN: uncharacterized protein LOC119591205 n=1 Tax=Penaeus monodon TaxID=6687 RepID=UPI0018A7434B|nr:LOW QUALITY PROTEIN: uncharacterized protein LOC119591205 [Penaeus monodon]